MWPFSPDASRTSEHRTLATSPRRRPLSSREEQRPRLVDHRLRAVTVIRHHRHGIVVAEVDVELRVDPIESAAVAHDAPARLHAEAETVLRRAELWLRCGEQPHALRLHQLPRLERLGETRQVADR